MASLPARQTASFFAIQPIPSATPLDDELNALVGAAGFLKGGTTGIKLLIKSSDATDPPVDFDQIGAGPLARFKQNTVTKITFNNDGTATFVNTAVNPGLNADRVDSIEGANIAQLNTHKSFFSTTIGFEPDPTITTTLTEDRQVWIAPNNVAEMKIERLWIHFNAGSHTAGGSLVYTLRKRDLDGNNPVDMGNVTLDNTNSTIRKVHYNDIADVTIVPGDTITFFKNSASGTNSERAISIGIVGFQKLSV